MQKSNYTKENLEEIEQSFRPTIMNNPFTFMSTIEQGIRHRKITNESLADKIQFLGIKLSKYQIQSEKLIFDHNNETSQDKTESSDDSELEVSLDNFLDSPLNHNIRNIIKNKKPSKRKRSLLEISNQQNNQNYFFNDLPSDQKQLSTGTLVIIKKIRDAFHITLFFQPILKILEFSAKNMLLSYSVSICEEFHMELRQDKDQFANQKLQKFSKNLFMNSMIFQAIEIRYSQILIGRYLCSIRMIDVEHQDPVVQTTNIEKQEKNDQQQSIQLQKTILIDQKLDKISRKDSVNESNNKKPQTVIKMKQQSKRNLRKQDSLQKSCAIWRFFKQSIKVKLIKFQFFHLNFNCFNNKTHISQQSMFRVMSSKHIDLNSSLQDISSSLSSSQNEETLNLFKFQTHHKYNCNKYSKHPIKYTLVQIYIIWMKILSKIYMQLLKYVHEFIKNENSNYGIFKKQNQIKFNKLNWPSKIIKIQNLLIISNLFLKLNQTLLFKIEIRFLFQLLNVDVSKLCMTQQKKKDDGNTAVHLALAYEHYKIADLLMESGGSTHIINRKGQNAWGIL
ncbi:unnamed protein product [Paramecium primaurelia]|uniref:Uncharacterized protein n=1 Tax=Paramecium primaurelia TaxID=5886 RepID=A0A8S1KG26_PARPR|nr:unnamed protein product [Paramecium primaurelia]